MMVVIIPAAFLVAISILVAVHEFGHYWVAKKLGFKVLRFSIGFGKPLLTRVGKDADRTEYCVAAISLGGYVKLWTSAKATWRRPSCIDPSPAVRSRHRIAVLLAGPAMNLLFASLLYAILAMVGTEIVKPVIGQVRLEQPGSNRRAAAGRSNHPRRPAQRQRHRRVADCLIRQFTSDGLVPLTLRRDGAESSVTLRVTADRRSLTEPGKLLPGLGFDLSTWNPPR